MDVARIRRIAVVGAGLMGHGIAQEFAQAGYPVGLHDLEEATLDRALGNIQANLTRLASMDWFDGNRTGEVIARIAPTTRLEEVLEGTDLVIEAVFEDLELKRSLLREIERCTGEATILASNSSSFVPSRLAEVLRHPERMLVAHYFNPPYLIPLVEVVPGPATASPIVRTIMAVLEAMGKRPVLLTREATGYVGNRLQFALFREALAIVEQGIADPEAVDDVVRFGFGRRLAAAGPFEIFDLAGLDTILAVAEQILPAIAADREAMDSRLLRERVERGELGVKTGRGFRDWSDEAVQSLRDRLTRALLAREPCFQPPLAQAETSVSESLDDRGQCRSGQP